MLSWLAMSRRKGVRVVVETDGVITNVVGFDKAEESDVARRGIWGGTLHVNGL